MSALSTLTVGVRVVRRDGVVERHTSHDAPLQVDGEIWVPTAGAAPQSLEQSLDLQANNVRLLGVITGDFTRSDLLAGLYDGARCELMLIDYRALTVVKRFLVGFFGDVRVIDGGQYYVDLYELGQELQKPLGRVVDIGCDAALGDARCGFPLVPDSGTVTAVTIDRRVFVDESREEADGHYAAGLLTWLSGANAGRMMDVKRYEAATHTIELYEPMPAAIAPGDVYTVTRGCDKRFATCRDQFGNAANFRGFPHVPGVSDLLDEQTSAG